MIAWLISRLRSILRIGQFMPYERQVLVWLAYGRSWIVGGATLGMFLVEQSQGWPWWVSVLHLVCLSSFAALLSADFIEHAARGWLLGYAYNPFVSAIGELEGWMGPVNMIDQQDRDGIVVWQAMQCGPPPGGNANPLLPWWGNPGSGSFCA